MKESIEKLLPCLFKGFTSYRCEICYKTQFENDGEFMRHVAECQRKMELLDNSRMYEAIRDHIKECQGGSVESFIAGVKWGRRNP